MYAFVYVFQISFTAIVLFISFTDCWPSVKNSMEEKQCTSLRKINRKSGVKQDRYSGKYISFLFPFQQFLKYSFLYFKWNSENSQILQSVDPDSLLITKDGWTCTIYTRMGGEGEVGVSGERRETRYAAQFHILGLMNNNNMRMSSASSACKIYLKTELDST